MSDIQEIKVQVLARLAVEKILSDLTDRGGLDGAWESIDDETRVEIILKWESIVLESIRGGSNA